jgi:hypothetical protein
MPLKSISTQVEFTVSGIACPEGSECMDALKCVEMGGRCVEGTARCGGRAQNCCCLLKPPAKILSTPCNGFEVRRSRNIVWSSFLTFNSM